MTMQLTEAQRQALLTQAVEAVRAYARADQPDADRDAVRRAHELATLAVTDAVTRGGHIHTLISRAAGVSGLVVCDLIADWTAQAVALRTERHAAEQYQRQIREAMQSHAVRRWGALGGRYGLVSQMSRELGRDRSDVDGWIAPARARQGESAT